MFKRVLKIRSTAEQVADFLREAIQSGQLQGRMPGVHALAKELGIHHTTAAEALGQLEKDGCIKGGGPGKKREILIPDGIDGFRLKVAILLYEPQDIGTQFINELRHQLSQEGHNPVVADKSLVELKFEVKRIKKVVDASKADVWLVISGSREVLKWFSEQETPAFALFGNPGVADIAHTGPVKIPLMREIIERLVGLGHRRIVHLVAEQLRKGEPTRLVQAFLDELERHDLPVGDYNLPDWGYDKGSPQACLVALFEVTPPTALIVDDPIFVPAILQFLNQRQLSIPGDVSLVCMDGDPSFEWMEPELTRMECDAEISIRHAVRWVRRVAKGKGDSRGHVSKAQLIEGGSIGPARS